MAADPATMDARPGAIAAELIASMEAHAASGEWERVEQVVTNLRATLLQVPVSERKSTLLAARRSMEKVHAAAQCAHHDVKEKLSAINRGKYATRAYAAAD